MASFKRRNLEATLKIIKNFSSGTLKPTQFSQALGGTGSTGSSTFYRNIADLNFYGLVDQLENGDFRFTDICKAIKEEKYPQATKEGKIKAFLHTELFREKIYREYKGSPIEFNDRVIEEIANDIRVNLEFVKAVIEVFVESGIYAGVVTRNPNNTILILDVDDIIGPPSVEETTEDELEGITDKQRDESTGGKRVIIPDDHEPHARPLNFGINFTLDGSTTSEMAENVFDFLREAGIGEKKKHQLELYVTEPPLKKELLEAVEKLLQDAKSEITVVTPYLDNQVLNILIPKAQQGIKVSVVTRPLKDFTRKEPQAAWKQLSEDPNIDHRCFEMLHSRMILVDKSVVLVSSADISHDSLEGEFNAGVLTNNPSIIRKSIKFIEELLKKGEKSKAP